MARVSSIEVLSYAAVTRAIQAESPTTGDAVAIYRDSIKALIALRTDLNDLKVREGQLVPQAQVQTLLRQHDEVLLSALKSMPRQLAAILSPEDPPVAEGILADWSSRTMAQIEKGHHGQR